MRSTRRRSASRCSSSSSKGRRNDRGSVGAGVGDADPLDGGVHAAAASGSARGEAMSVRSGLDIWSSQGFPALKGLRVGAIVNPTSVDARFVHLADLLAKADGVKLAALFGPEHGVRGEAQYMVAVDDVAR